jgi:hypothetical protein
MPGEKFPLETLNTPQSELEYGADMLAQQPDMQTDLRTHVEQLATNAGQLDTESPTTNETNDIVRDPSLMSGDHVDTQIEWQAANEIVDQRGIKYPEFSINHTLVIFRNRNEFPQLDNPYHDAGNGELSSVLPFGEHTSAPAERTKYLGEATSELKKGVIEVVTNTPLGLVGAAIELGSSNPDLIELRGKLISKEYDERAIALLDSIAAAVTVGEDGLNHQDGIDTNGYGLVLSALVGNPEANTLLGTKIGNYHKQRSEDGIDKIARSRRFVEETELWKNTESAKPEEIVLVHSTSHAIEYDADGNVILFPANAKREDELPRASLHFTVNAEVKSHMWGAWDKNNRVILANFKKVIGQNGLPANARDVDTYFDINPGEHLTLPDAVVLEARDDGQLIQTEDKIISYAHKMSYSEAESLQISQMAREQGLNPEKYTAESDLLREIALRTAMATQGAKKFVVAGEHYVNDPYFQRAYQKMANELGVWNTGGHMSTAESSLVEVVTSDQFDGSFSGFNTNGSYGLAFSTEIPDAAIRTIIANGFMPARPLQRSPKEIASWIDLSF